MLRRTTIMLSEQLLRKFKSILALEGKTMSEVIAEMIEQYIKQYEEEKERRKVKTC